MARVGKMSVSGLIGTFSIMLLTAVGNSAASAQSAHSAAYPAPPQVQAVDTTLVKIDDASARRFETAFASISEQAHVLIVSEGTLLHPTLTEEKSAALRRVVPLGAQIPLDFALARLAEAYDYGVEQTDPHTFLLLKRYTDPEDLPRVTYDEIVHALRSIVQVGDKFTSNIVPGELSKNGPVNRLLDSLSVEQAVKAKSGIRLIDLNPDQQELALAAIKDMTYRPQFNNLIRLARMLSVLPRRNTVFEWVDAKRSDGSPARAFGFDGAFGANDAVIGVPITDPFVLFGGPSYIWASPAPMPSAQAQARQTNGTAGAPAAMTGKDPGSKDLTLPTDLDRKLAAGMLTPYLSSTLTLGEATRRAESLPYGADNDVETPADLPFGDVDDAVVNKPVNVFGFRFSGTKRHFMEALGAVYGLQLATGDHHRIALELPSPRAHFEPYQTPAEIERLIPAPLTRAYFGQINSDPPLGRDEGFEYFSLASPVTGSTFHPLSPPLSGGQGTYTRIPGTNVENLYYACVRRLVAFAEPAVPTPGSRPVQVASLGPEANRLIALTLLAAGGLRDMMNVRNYIPANALIDPDAIHLTMSRDTSGKSPKLRMSYYTGEHDGASVAGGVFSSVTVPPHTTVHLNIGAP